MILAARAFEFGTTLIEHTRKNNITAEADTGTARWALGEVHNGGVEVGDTAWTTCNCLGDEKKPSKRGPVFEPLFDFLLPIDLRRSTTSGRCASALQRRTAA